VSGGPGIDRTESDSIVNVEDVRASFGADTITGNSLANRIEAGPGKDTVTAGAGNDTLDLDDDQADTAACGEGNDSVVGDADLDVITGCESAIDGDTGKPFGGGSPNPTPTPTPTPSPSPTPGPTPGGATPGGGGGAPAGGGAASPFTGFTTFTAGLAGVNAFQAAATRTGRAYVPPATFDAYAFTCAQACDGTMTGQLTATAGKAQAATLKPLKLKTAKFKGGPGTPVRLKVKLPAKAVRLVKKRKRAKLALVTVVRSGGKSARLPATIRLKAKR
jgi:RTX calcium-binding nonapeptide repeat (4 copies)